MNASSKLIALSNDVHELERRLERITLCARFAIDAYVKPYSAPQTIDRQMRQLHESVAGDCKYHDTEAYSLASMDERLRQSILHWLQVNDRNGVYTDAECDDEGLPRFTLQTAVQSLVDALEE